MRHINNYAITWSFSDTMIYQKSRSMCANSKLLSTAFLQAYLEKHLSALSALAALPGHVLPSFTAAAFCLDGVTSSFTICNT